MFRNLFLIGIGSFAGGTCRFLCQQLMEKYFPAAIPTGTLSVNIIGCFVIGIIYGLSAKDDFISPEIKFLLTTGFCGGYTTFSSFAFENITMLRNGEFFYTALYIFLSVVAGLAAVFAGLWLTK